MAFIPLPDCVKIEFKYRKNGALVVNVMWGRVLIEIDSTALQDIAQAVVTWWTSIRDDQVVTSMALEEVIVTDWTEESGLQHVEIVSPPAAGTNAGTDLPSNVAAVVSLYTGYSGRSFRGRQYWAGMPESAITANQIATAYLAVMVSDMGELRDALFAVDCRLVVASFRHNNAPRVTGVSTLISDWGADNVVDTQRRRIPHSYA